MVDLNREREGGGHGLSMTLGIGTFCLLNLSLPATLGKPSLRRSQLYLLSSWGNKWASKKKSLGELIRDCRESALNLGSATCSPSLCTICVLFEPGSWWGISTWNDTFLFTIQTTERPDACRSKQDVLANAGTAVPALHPAGARLPDLHQVLLLLAVFTAFPCTDCRAAGPSHPYFL